MVVLSINIHCFNNLTSTHLAPSAPSSLFSKLSSYINTTAMEGFLPGLPLQEVLLLAHSGPLYPAGSLMEGGYVLLLRLALSP